MTKTLLTGLVVAFALAVAIPAQSAAEQDEESRVAGATDWARYVRTIEKKQSERRQMRKARTFNRQRIPGTKVAAGVKKIFTELDWHRDIHTGLAEAERVGRPLLWIRALGDLDGFL